MTYIMTYEGWLYLTVVFDLFSPCGWSMGGRMTAKLVMDALLMSKRPIKDVG